MERISEKVLKVDIDMTGGDKVDRRVGGGSVVEEESREDFFYNQTGPGMFCVFVRKKRGYFERKFQSPNFPTFSQSKPLLHEMNALFCAVRVPTMTKNILQP